MVTITKAQRKALDDLQEAFRFTRILAGYECVDGDEEMPPCGECGPCEARAFLQRVETRAKATPKDGAR